VWGSPTDVLGLPIYVWALTGGDTGIRWDGTTWSVLSPLTGLGVTRPGVSWTFVTGSAAYDTWVFGVDKGPVPDFELALPVSRRFNGTSWIKGLPDDYAFGIGVDGWFGYQGLWVVAGPRAYRLGGLGWTSSYTGDTGGLVGIWGANEMWAIGAHGSLMHRARLD